MFVKTETTAESVENAEKKPARDTS